MGAQPDGSYLVPTNQRLTPAGHLHKFKGYVSDAALSPDCSKLAVLGQSGVTIFSWETPDAGGSRAVPPEPEIGNVPGVVNFMGLAWGDDSAVYAASGDKIKAIRDVDGKWKVVATIDGQTATKPGGSDSVPIGPLACSPDGKLLFASVSIRNAVHVFSLPDGKLLRKVPVGICPNRLAVASDGRTLYVTNRGGERRDLPAYDLCDSGGTPVPLARGKDTSAEGSVTRIDLQDYSTRAIKVGHQPAGLALSRDGRTLYVGCSDDDTVEVVDTASGKVRGRCSLRPARDPGYGQIPTSLALSPDGARLFVACGGANAIAVLTTGNRPSVKGYIPTCWYPNAVVAGNQMLGVSCRKGLGSIMRTARRGIGSHDLVGTLQAVPYQDLEGLPRLSEEVADDNGWGTEDLPARPNVDPVPIPARVGEPSLFKHVVYIVKENLAYDAVLGDLDNGKGDPQLCLFPRAVTPNTHALAEEFGTLTNANASAQCSAEGHQWAIAAVANGYVEMTDWSRSYPKRGDDALAHSPAGSLWNPVCAKGLSVKCYGWYADKTKITDSKSGVSKNMSDWKAKALWDLYQNRPGDVVVETHATTRTLDPHVVRGFPVWACNFPEVWKADIFLKDFHQWEKTGGMPALTMLQLGNDHTAGTDPEFPTPRAMQADNDEAFGRVVDAISHSKYWKDTLIIVCEDDSQLGRDHIDGHRTVMMMISPYSRRHTVIDEPYNQTSLIRTIGLVLGFKPLNRFDRTASALWECVTSTPDYRPFNALTSSVALTEWNPPVSALSGEDRKLALQCMHMNWTVADIQDPDIVTRAVWRSVKGGRRIPAYAFKNVDRDDD
jgi:DNA-binding beta-propeller fold protein YncE